MLDWNDFKDLDTSTVIPVNLNQQLVQLLLTALDELDKQDWTNDDKDTRESVIAEVSHVLSG